MITVSTSLYRRSTMKNPRGRGNWWFSIGSTAGYDDITKAWSPNGHYTYTEACKLAKKEARKRGANIVFVLP